MGDHDDKVFIKRFSGIIAGLVIVTILIIIISVATDNPDSGANPSRAILAAERIAPVAAVRTELPEAEAVSVASVAPGDVQQPAAAAIDGAAIFSSTCGACHLSGIADAPIPGSEAWAERAASGIDSLTSNVIAGMGVMPPKGGRPDLSDDEIRAAVEHMLAQ